MYHSFLSPWYRNAWSWTKPVLCHCVMYEAGVSKHASIIKAVAAIVLVRCACNVAGQAVLPRACPSPSKTRTPSPSHSIPHTPVHRGQAQLLNRGGIFSLAHVRCQYSWQASQQTGRFPPRVPIGSKHFEQGWFSIFTSVDTTLNLGKGLGRFETSMSSYEDEATCGAANAAALCSAPCSHTLLLAFPSAQTRCAQPHNECCIDGSDQMWYNKAKGGTSNGAVLVHGRLFGVRGSPSADAD